MTQKDFFAALGAPLANARWSWGSVREDGVVVLRVWQDEVKKRDGSIFVKVAYKPKLQQDDGDPLGHRERLDHVERIRRGATSYLVVCQAVDVDAKPRKVKDFEHECVFCGGQLVKMHGCWWIELGRRIPVREVAGVRE